MIVLNLMPIGFAIQAEALVLPGECVKFALTETTNTTLSTVDFTVPITGGVSMYIKKVKNGTNGSRENQEQEMWYYTPGFSLFKYARVGLSVSVLFLSYRISLSARLLIPAPPHALLILFKCSIKNW